MSFGDMFYEKEFWLYGPYGNNMISYEERKKNLGEEPVLYVTRLVKSSCLEVLDVGNNPVFQEIEENELYSMRGLNYFIQSSFGNVPVYIFDNHNHAFFFWYKAYKEGVIAKGNQLLHIDQHSDMRKPAGEFDSRRENEIEYIGNYTNYVLSVGDYIKPALESGLISDVHRIKTQNQLKSFDIKNMEKGFVLNVDMDFWFAGMSFIEQSDLTEILKSLIWKAELVTIASSPFFVDQNKAIAKIKEILIN